MFLSSVPRQCSEHTMHGVAQWFGDPGFQTWNLPGEKEVTDYLDLLTSWQNKQTATSRCHP